MSYRRFTSEENDLIDCTWEQSGGKHCKLTCCMCVSVKERQRDRLYKDAEKEIDIARKNEDITNHRPSAKKSASCAALMERWQRRSVDASSLTAAAVVAKA